MVRYLRDPLVVPYTEKASFFEKNEKWRKLPPSEADWHPATPEEVEAELKARRDLYEDVSKLARVCVICKREIALGDPNFLLTNLETGNRAFCCYDCRQSSRLKSPRVKASLRDPLMTLVSLKGE